jgi:hypothetical protein
MNNVGEAFQGNNLLDSVRALFNNHVQVFSWDEIMELFRADEFVELGFRINTWRFGLFEGTEIPEHIRVGAKGMLPTVLPLLASHKLEQSVEKLRIIIGMLDEHPSIYTASRFKFDLDEVERLLKHELSRGIGLFIERESVQLFALSERGWDRTLVKFPNSRKDIDRAAKCLALEQPMASVFHSMRILEPGLFSLVKHMKVTTVKPTDSWGIIIGKIESHMTAMNKQPPPLWVKNRQFYSEAAAQFQYFKDAWRNDSFHVRADLDLDDAKNIHGATRTFMEHISKRLRA